MIWYFGFWIFIFGLFIGSFLNVCIYRIPNKKSIITPGSTCPNCNTRLKPLDLFPVFSYLFLGRKCRYCGTPISSRYMLVELLTAVLFTICFIVFGISGKTIALIVLTGVLITITFTDYDHTIIPDSIVLFGFLCGVIFVFLGFVPYEGADLADNLIGAGLGMVCGALPLIIINLLSKLILKRDGIGGGDIKLMGMAGVYLGYKNIIAALGIGILIGGIYGIIVLANRRKKQNSSENDDKFHEIPFGPYLAMGIYICMLFGTQIISWYLGLYY